MLFALAAAITAGCYLQAPQSAGPRVPQPLADLIGDLEAAIPRAHTTEDQKHRLESDDAVLRSAREAKQQNRPIDRGQVTGAVKDLHRILGSGAFSPEDREKLNADIGVLRRQ